MSDDNERMKRLFAANVQRYNEFQASIEIDPSLQLDKDFDETFPFTASLPCHMPVDYTLEDAVEEVTL